MIKRRLDRIRSEERGVTMVIVLAILLVMMLLTTVVVQSTINLRAVSYTHQTLPTICSV